MKRLLLAAFLIAGIHAPAVHPADPAEAAAVDAQYRQSVEMARAGRTAESLVTLRALSERFPQRQDLLGDYAVILGWAGQHAAAVALLPRIDRPNAPAYVIEGVAGSALAVQQIDLAEALYLASLARFPGRVEARIGLAEVATARRDFFGALTAYQDILADLPDHRGALRGKVLTLARLGVPQLALEIAERHPGLLAPPERDAIAADVTAHRIRWGGIAADTGRGLARFEQLDQALAESDAAGARALDPAAVLTPIERQLALDRIGALRDRFRMRDAIALYDAMAARPEAVPAWAKSAAASACLYVEKPERARDLYREALATDPDNLESRIGLFYALAEAEEHAAALDTIERAVAITPMWIGAWSPATTHENPAYARVHSARSMAPLFANQPGEAEQRLRALSGSAPYNMGIRTDFASSMRARGWPRMAEEELRWILATEPDNSGALGEHAGALLEMRDYRKAGTALALAQSVSAEDGRVVRAARLWHVHNMRELIVDGTAGRSSGGPFGTRDHVLDARLYSRPLDYNYRFFLHTYNAEATFATGTGRRNRAGAGFEYRSPRIVASGELSHDLDDSRNGAAASLAYSPDDYWTFRGTLDSSANETPLQARFAGINARRGAAEAVWQANESRGAALGIGRMNFSDGNRRDTVQARWTERVIAGPVYKLEVTGGLYASSNSLAGAPYFNPSRDFSPTLEFANEWIQWRRYTRAFRHRFVVALGSYWQQGFGSGPAYGARYEQEWAADDRLTLRYGLGRSIHPYDGVRTPRNYAYFALNWKF